MKSKIYYFLLLLFVINSDNCFAIDNDTPVDIDYSFKAAINVEQSIEEFDKVPFETFDNLNLVFFRGNLWLRLDIKNQSNSDKSCMFISNDRFNRNYIFYKLDTTSNSLVLANQVKQETQNDYRTFNEPNPNLKIDLSPEEKATYLIISASDGRTKDATPKIISLESYFNYTSESKISDIIFYTVIFCLLIINIQQWNIYKRKIYLFCIFYMISTSLVYLGIEGYLYTFITIFKLDQNFMDHVIFVSVKLWALSLILYTSKFLEIKAVAPRYYKFIKATLVIVLGGILLYQFVFYNSSIQHLHYFENVLSLLWLLLIIGMILFSAKARRMELKYYLIPLAFFILFTVIGVVNVHLQIFAGNSFTYVKIGAVVEFIGFTYFMTKLIKQKLKSSDTLKQTLKENEKEIKHKDELLSKKIEKTDLLGIFSLLENTLSTENEWDEFKLKLEELNPNFYDNLTSKHSRLTKSEIRLLVLIRIGYTQKEIANLLNIAPESVKKARTRVRKKLNLDGNVKLNIYLKDF